MRFDMTKGQDAKYMVSVYRWNGEDYIYFHSFKEAKDCFNKKKESEGAGTSISIWDMKKDIRKDYVKL